MLPKMQSFSKNNGPILQRPYNYELAKVLAWGYIISTLGEQLEETSKSIMIEFVLEDNLSRTQKLREIFRATWKCGRVILYLIHHYFISSLRSEEVGEIIIGDNNMVEK